MRHVDEPNNVSSKFDPKNYCVFEFHYFKEPFLKTIPSNHSSFKIRWLFIQNLKEISTKTKILLGKT